MQRKCVCVFWWGGTPILLPGFKYLSLKSGFASLAYYASLLDVPFVRRILLGRRVLTQSSSQGLMCTPLTLPLASSTFSVHVLLSLLLFLIFIPLLLALVPMSSLMLARRHPRVPVPLHRLVLAREIHALAIPMLGGVGLPPLAQSSRARAELGAHDGMAADPVGEGVLAVLDDCFAGLVAVIGISRLAGSDGRVVDEFEEVLAVAGNDSKLLAVLAHRVELVGECRFELLTGDVAQLCFSDKAFGFGADKFLFQYDDAWAVGFFILELGDLVGYLLLAVTRGLDRGFNVADRFDGYTVLIVAVDKLVFKFANLVDQDAKFVGYVADIVVASFAPDRKLLLERMSGQQVI
jgi:hypothetical protein